MSTLFVIDIDGTIAHGGERFVKAGSEPSRDDRAVYDAWLKSIQNERSLMEDRHVAGMTELVHALSSSDSEVVYVTAREEKFKEVTTKWLAMKGFPQLPLLMRPDEDYSDTADYKEATIKFLVRLYGCSTVVVLDDDEQGTIEKMCNKNGYTLLKARSGGQR